MSCSNTCKKTFLHIFIQKKVAKVSFRVKKKRVSSNLKFLLKLNFVFKINFVLLIVKIDVKNEFFVKKMKFFFKKMKFLLKNEIFVKK